MGEFQAVPGRHECHRKQFTGAGDTLSRELDDPQLVTVVVRFGDLEKAKAWVEATSDEDVLKDISRSASLTDLPEFWLGEDVEDVEDVDY